MASMAETWELGLDKLNIQNLQNFIEMMGGDKGMAQKKGEKQRLLKKVWALLDDAFIEAKITQLNKQQTKQTKCM